MVGMVLDGVTGTKQLVTGLHAGGCATERLHSLLCNLVIILCRMGWRSWPDGCGDMAAEGLHVRAEISAARGAWGVMSFVLPLQLTEAADGAHIAGAAHSWQRSKGLRLLHRSARA